MLTPLKELGDIDHTFLFQEEKRVVVGQTFRGQFAEGGTYCGTVEFVGDREAVVQVISHTYPSPVTKGQRVRFIFNSTKTA